MSQILTLELSDEIYTNLQQQAELTGISISELIINSLKKQYFPVKKRRQSGTAKGLIVMSSDFNQPLPDFDEYMG